MNHQKTNYHSSYDDQKSIRAASRRERNAEILDIVRNVCQKFGGMAEIGNGFVVVDTSKYEVKSK